jgi:hypothetical protein
MGNCCSGADWRVGEDIESIPTSEFVTVWDAWLMGGCVNEGN